MRVRTNLSLDDLNVASDSLRTLLRQHRCNVNQDNGSCSCVVVCHIALCALDVLSNKVSMIQLVVSSEKQIVVVAKLVIVAHLKCM